MRPLLLAVGLIVCVHPSSLDAQAQHVRLQSTADGDVVTTRRSVAQLRNAQAQLFDLHYGDAASEFSGLIANKDVESNDTLAAWAYHGMAIARALGGDRQGARATYDKFLHVAPESPLAIADSIEAAVLTGRRGTAESLLARFAASRPGVLPRQYVHSFRALSLLIAGQCDAAVAEVRRAPDPDRPLPQAIRGRCAAAAGRHAEAIALRDSVLTHPLADPLSWPMIIARGVARKIQ
jgi:tetratricopeptide (TPR) repeat protein